MATEYKLSYTAEEINSKLGQIDELSEEIANLLPKNQGTANVGKILVVGTDGNLTLAEMPEAGASGDIVGVLDESNNILLSGNLADGTYTLKYQNTDGTFTDIGNLVVGESGVSYTNLADPTSDEWLENYRITSGGSVEAYSGVTLVNTIVAGMNDVVRIKGMSSVLVGMYKSGTWYTRKTVNTTNFYNLVTDGDYYEFTHGYNDVTELRFYGTLTGTAEDVIITVNEEITE